MKAVFEDTGSTVSGPWVNSPLRRSGPRVLSRSRPRPRSMSSGFGKGRAEQCENSAIEKGEREREGQGEEEKRQGSQCETSYREREGKNRQCEVKQTYPRTESEDAIVSFEPKLEP